MCACFPEFKIGQKLNEGKTKQIFELENQPGLVLVQSKDQITAGNAVRKDQMEGKAAIANKTTSCVFKLLQESGEDSSKPVLWVMHSGISARKCFTRNLNELSHMLRNKSCYCWVEAMGVKLL